MTTRAATSETGTMDRPARSAKTCDIAQAKHDSLAGKIFAPNYTTIPSELMELSQWVAWKYVPNPGQSKPRKILVNPESGKWAKTDDPATWGRLTTALARYVCDDLDGIGFVFTAGDPYCGIDLDKCVDPSSGFLNEQAREIVDALQSYTELSPSGTGLHIIVRATLSAKGRKRDAIEIYDRGRYFTVTGQPLEQPLHEIFDRQEVVDRLYATLRPPTRSPREKSESRRLIGPELPDAKVIDCILASPHGRTFSVLYGGGAESRHSSHSEADLALTGILATYIGNNPKQIDRIFRGSALYREKWDEQRGAFTYGEMTIQKALGEEE